MKAYHEGKSIDEYLDDIWARRRHEWGHAPSSGGGWPYKSMAAIRDAADADAASWNAAMAAAWAATGEAAEAAQSNVQPIKKRKT